MAECPEARAFLESSETVKALSNLRASTLVDYAAVAALKLRILRILHRSFETNHAQRQTSRGEAFLQFLRQSGATLDQFATFQMLSEQFATHDWTRWPAAFQRPSLDSILTQQNPDRILFFKYLQWLCESRRGPQQGYGHWALQ